MNSGVPTGAGNPPPPTILPPTNQEQQKRPVGRPPGSKNTSRKSMGNDQGQEKRPVGRPPGSKNTSKKSMGNEGQGKRPVGRPPGSKKKPKTQIIINIPEGSERLQCLLEFRAPAQVSVTVLDAPDQLANIFPCSQPNFNIPGPLPTVSLSGTVVPTPPPLSGATTSQKTIFPPSSDGAVCGGIAARTATAASTVNAVVNIETTRPVSDAPPPTENQNSLSDYFRSIEEDVIEVNNFNGFENIRFEGILDEVNETFYGSTGSTADTKNIYVDIDW